MSDLEVWVEAVVERAVESGCADRLSVRRERTGDDPVVLVDLAEGHVLSLRVKGERRVQFTLDGSGVLEVDSGDGDRLDLEWLLMAYCAAELEVEVDLRLGQFRAFRRGDDVFYLSQPLFARWWGPREWRRID
ncbi:hypothetical protein KCV87_33770 [Actinosynnema pretiosum subsp. pretiosum]|uniref:Uncharacterized protein n=2 Tax=Actinosynnema TaxID=40566 RepID=C6WK33_ACTMD|nr:hypothetical protein [Actinosynnema mirum]ACU38246.1 hypothetical protein Amir_4397 [Actinosynnema mirum DSM 43827]QUF04233.1 hypothetical protein KCV87_33770 [Actinosynnema pretiosum subsp. pretiosum]